MYSFLTPKIRITAFLRLVWGGQWFFWHKDIDIHVFSCPYFNHSGNFENPLQFPVK
ncbi:hypothetical protein PCS8203_00204 [Streptococcus pneumoniae PCS8203]|nr:hypothetical protein PCS8106_01733 [Streptococcus pneumoniae PCS8106]ELU59445.1 hypothetical protein PCS8203_00204 [Streptococcus pneumoniae PCS8203]